MELCAAGDRRRSRAVLDNDGIIREVSEAIGQWSDAGAPRCLMAEDERASFWQFVGLCGDAARNSGAAARFVEASGRP